MVKKKVIFLDRDGTLIRDVHYLNDPRGIEYLPTTFEALAKLKNSGFEFIIVTNQSGVAKGLVEPAKLEEIHLKMKRDFSKEKIEFLDIAICTADSDSDDFRRKPQPGMIMEALNRYNIDASKSWMIGDKKTDVQAGHRAGVQSLFLDTGKEPPPNEVPSFKRLLDAAAFILSRGNISN